VRRDSAGGADERAPRDDQQRNHDQAPPDDSLRPRKIAAKTTVHKTPVPTIGATTVTRPRSSASKSVACASAVTTPELAYGQNAVRSRAALDATWRRGGRRARHQRRGG
jgi:hypothetical protein